MSEKIENPFEPDNGEALASRLVDIEVKLDELANRLEVRDSDQDDQLRRLLIAEIRQRMDFRTIAMTTAGICLVFMAVYAFCAFNAATLNKGLFPQSPSLLVALVVAPIASITTVTAMILLGAFRRFKDDDPEKISSSSIAGEAIKQTIGN